MAALLGSATMWFIVGVLLLIVEAMHTGILAVFFAVGAWVTAALMWLGIISGTSAQLAVFLIVSIVSLLLLRSKLRKWMTGLIHPAGEDAALDDFVGNLATVVEDIEPGQGFLRHFRLPLGYHPTFPDYYAQPDREDRSRPNL